MPGDGRVLLRWAQGASRVVLSRPAMLSLGQHTNTVVVRTHAFNEIFGDMLLNSLLQTLASSTNVSVITLTLEQVNNVAN